MAASLRRAQILALLITLVGFHITRAADNELTSAEKRAGWQMLFDGKSTKGWRNYKKQSISKGWKVVDGALTRASGGAGDILTLEQYDNFELSIEYRISKGGNSGIMFHVAETERAPWQTGPEIQIQDNVDGHDPQKSGWVYQLYPARTDSTRPAGEWNQLHIRITEAQCEINMNGIRYARFQKGGADWDRRVAKSKFSKFANFGKAKKGFICLQDHGNQVAYRNIKIRKLATGIVINPIDDTLDVGVTEAFPRLKWTNWEPLDDRGRPRALRPIVITHAGDGSNRLFVVTQRGVCHELSSPKATETSIFMDIEKKVRYSDKQNEEGLLGFAFHPKFKTNGQVFVYYTTREQPQTSIISRFQLKKGGKTIDADSEEELMRIKQPFWNHNGGTICFGPDGYLYIGLGDGGAANDPHKNAQNLGTLLGSILRIDVDKKSSARKYGIPADNPFAKKKGARPEIWAYGLRNVWRMSFDRKTGQLWAADVGQNLWEEINIVTRGGNYGWNVREAAHPFGNSNASTKGMIDPVWEYDHTVGKSITGGVVYRGKAVPELQGAYLYGDYVSGKLWALRYDSKAKKVVSNSAISASNLQAITYGEDEQGEVYIGTVTANGRGIYRLIQK